MSPSGEVARLPDWRPGTLVVDVAADVTVRMVGRARRRAGAGRGPPDHVRRELREELARDDLEVGPFIGRRCHTFWLGRWMTQRERWVLCHAEPFQVDPAHVTTLAAEAIQELRWWSPDELRASRILAHPRDLADLLAWVARGDLPDPDQDLGI